MVITAQNTMVVQPRLEIKYGDVLPLFASNIFLILCVTIGEWISISKEIRDGFIFVPGFDHFSMYGSCCLMLLNY